MGRAVDCLVDGSNMVRKYLPEFRASGQLQSYLWTNYHDDVRRIVEHTTADELRTSILLYVHIDLIRVLSHDIHTFEHCCCNQFCKPMLPYARVCTLLNRTSERYSGSK